DFPGPVAMPWSDRSQSLLKQPMRRPFLSFPSANAGAGLLLLRLAVGVTTISEAAPFLVGSERSAAIRAAAAAIAMVGATIMVGFQTSSAALGLVLAGIAWLSFGGMPVNSWLSPLALVLLAADALSLMLLGPGAFSLDALLFGRREIPIPRDPSANL